MADQNPVEENFETSWQLDSIAINSTLTKPVGSGPFPAVVMVAGSGPTDRDWNSPLLPGTNGSARLLAEALARVGIASVRYDKRGSGPHARENAMTLSGKVSMQSHVDELAGAVRTLADQSYVRKDRIFALGNSEGTLHILNYQLHNPKIPFAGLVLTGLPGRSVGVVARSQLAAQAASVPNGDALLALYDAAVSRFLAGEPANPDPALPQGVQMLLKSLEAPVNLPFARELWMTDGVPLLKQINIPTLVVIGKKDIQVDWQVDGGLLQQAAAEHKGTTFLFPENANHVLKEELRPRPELTAANVGESYNGADAHLDPKTLIDIVKWLTDLSA